MENINIFKTYQDKENIRTCIIQEKGSIFQSAQFSLNSILFRHKTITPFVNGVTMLYELYGDMSIKIHVPLYPMRDFDKECARNRICECTSTNIDENASYKIIDGVIAVNSIWASIKKHIDLLKKYDTKEIWELDFEEFVQNELSEEEINKILKSKSLEEEKRNLEYMNQKNIKLIGIKDEKYPRKLHRIEDKPAFLYVRGNENILDDDAVRSGWL